MKSRRINSRSRVFIRKPAAMLAAIIGFIMCQPFFWLVMVFGAHEPYMSLIRMLWTLLMIIGLPMFMFGVIGAFTSGRSTSHTSEQELSRIRHSLETRR